MPEIKRKKCSVVTHFIEFGVIICVIKHFFFFKHFLVNLNELFRTYCENHDHFKRYNLLMCNLHSI